MPQPVQDSLAILKDAQKSINEKLNDPIYSYNRLEINTLFERLSTRLVFMGAVTEPDLTQKQSSAFPPITNFMGEDIIHATRITSADLNPQEHERMVFKEKVQKLYDSFTTLGPQAVLKAYSMSDDVLVLRGVAKWAGIADYNKRALDIAFMEAIAKGIESKEAVKTKQKSVEDALNKEKQNAELLSSLNDDPEITLEEITADPKLQAINAIPGDRLSVVLKALETGEKLHPDANNIQLDKNGKPIKTIQK